jgi:hypothetical protein
MSPTAIYVTETAVYIQWTKRSQFVGYHEDGTTTEQFREPTGGRYVLTDRNDPPPYVPIKVR